jgi:hypothetical protein
MIFFCLLLIPLLYIIRLPVSSGEGGKSFWILLMGFVAVILQYFIGDLVPPGGFGLSRWMSGFVDFISLPVLIPFIVCMLLIKLRNFSFDIAGFILLWLIPASIYRAVIWISPGYPVFIVLVPLLWAAQTFGISFITNLMIKYSRKYIIAALLALCLLALPILASTCWWAFYSQQTLLGFLFLFAAFIPAVLSVIFDFSRKA